MIDNEYKEEVEITSAEFNMPLQMISDSNAKQDPPLPRVMPESMRDYSLSVLKEYKENESCEISPGYSDNSLLNMPKKRIGE